MVELDVDAPVLPLVDVEPVAPVVEVLELEELVDEPLQPTATQIAAIANAYLQKVMFASLVRMYPSHDTTFQLRTWRDSWAPTVPVTDFSTVLSNLLSANDGAFTRSRTCRTRTSATW